jgi:FkbM family methyltransferase
LIKIDFQSKPINFYQSVIFSKKKKIPNHVILKQAYEQSVLIDNEKKLLLDFIEYIKESNYNFKSQLYQDLFVSFIVKDNYNKTFLEFGATNGFDLSNTFLLENQLSWSGVLAEPDTQWLNQLKKNRPKAKIISKCIWKNSFEKLNFFSSEIGVLSTLDSFKFSDAESMPGNTKARVKSGKNIEVETISLNQVIEEEFNGKSPAYISIDTEGSEFEILNSLDFSKYRPTVFTVEHNFTQLQDKIDKLMSDNNYIRVFTKLTAFDAWYISAKALDKLR